MSAFTHTHSNASRRWHGARTASAAISASCVGLGAFAAQAADSNVTSRGMEVVVVTAQRRAEQLQDVPISISVLGGVELDSSTSRGVTEALTSVPGVATMANRQGGGTTITVRGVASGGPVFTGSSPVAYYVDSVPFALVKTAIAPDGSAYDLERVEVLRGPQGTLYGASALNGVVRVLTNDANLEKFEFKARVSTSGIEDGGESYRGDAAINVPIIEGKLAARAVVGYQDSSGWVDKPNRKDSNDEELGSLRLKVSMQPTERFSAEMSAWLSRADYGAPSTSDENRRVISTLDEPNKIDYDTFGLNLDYDLGSLSVSSMTGYLKYDNGGILDAAASSPAGIGVALVFSGFDAEVLAQELSINSAGEGPWRWSVGGMYRDAEDNLRQEGGFLPATIDFTNVSKSYAVFGELTRVFGDGRFELTGGLRYFEDEVTVRENLPSTPGQPLLSDGAKFDQVTPRVILSWHPSSDLTAYVSYSEGFRSGFPQDPPVVRAAPDLPPVEADSLANYEIGAKGNLWNDVVSFDTAVYYIDWQDAQQQIRVNAAAPGRPPAFLSALINSESVSGVGVDFGVTTRPTDRLQFGLNVSWNDLGLDSQVFSRGVLLFEEGDRPNLSSEYTAGASADYNFPLGSTGIEASFSMAANYASAMDRRTMSAGGARAIALGDSLLIARTSFSLHSPNRWGATLFVDNLTDEKGTVLGQPDPANPAGSFSVFDIRPRPRTMGIQFDYRY